MDDGQLSEILVQRYQDPTLTRRPRQNLIVPRVTLPVPGPYDLMARLAGLEFEARFADWERSPFTAESPSHVSVWRKP